MSGCSIIHFHFIDGDSSTEIIEVLEGCATSSASGKMADGQEMESPDAVLSVAD